MPRLMPTTLRPRFRAQARGGGLLRHVPNRPPRFPTSTPPPGPSARPSGFSIRSQQDSIGFNPTAFKAPVRTSVATEFNSGERRYDTIPARHPSIRARGNFMPKRKAPLAVLVAFGSVHHIRPRRAPLVRMAGRVLLAAVRLGFGNAPPNDASILHPTAQPRADKRLCTPR